MVKRKAIRKMNKMSNKIKTRRQKTNKNKRVTPPTTEKLWSRDLNAKDNFKNLNITYDLNVIDKLSNKNLTDIVGTVEVEEEYTLDQIKQLNEGTFSESKAKITQDEGFLVRNLYKKYGEDYNKMVMDHKVNKMQWNANQIKKKFDAYKKKFGTVEQDFELFKN